MQLAQRQRDGRPLRDHLLAAKRQGHAHPLLQAQPLPPGGAQLWALLQELCSSRQQGMSGAIGLQRTEVESWQRLYGVRLTPWELDTLFAMDGAMRNAAAAAAAANAGQSSAGRAPHSAAKGRLQ